MPKADFRGVVIRMLVTVVIRVFFHRHIAKTPFCFEFPIICQGIFIGLLEQFVWGFPTAELIQPSWADEHHVVSVPVIVFALLDEHVDEVEEIRQFVVFVDHAAKDVLRMGSEPLSRG